MERRSSEKISGAPALRATPWIGPIASAKSLPDSNEDICANNLQSNVTPKRTPGNNVFLRKSVERRDDLIHHMLNIENELINIDKRHHAQLEQTQNMIKETIEISVSTAIKHFLGNPCAELSEENDELNGTCVSLIH